MPITLYTAPNCQRCTILKEFLASRGQEFIAYDFQADKDTFNSFYRAHRSSLHRDDENRVEFPIYDDGTIIKQGIGEILAYLLSGHALEPCVGTSGMMHGWISGLNVSACPRGQEENFLALLRLLARGGLSVFLDSDGRRADLLEKILAEGLVARLALDILGPAELYPAIAGGPLTPEDLNRSIALTRACKDHLIRLLIAPFAGPAGDATRITPDQAGEAARMVLDACSDRMIPFVIETAPAGQLPPLTDQDLLPYRSKVRGTLVKAEIRKPESH
jgi:hypothetical protein